MDPNAALNIARNAAARMTAEEADSMDWNDVDSLLDAFLALDAWLSRGGFLPTAWATS